VDSGERGLHAVEDGATGLSGVGEESGVKRVIITIDDTVDIKRWRKTLKDMPFVTRVEVRSVAAAEGEVKAFIDHAYDTHLLKFGVRLHVNGGQDGTMVKKLLGTYSPEELRLYWDRHLKDTDKWIVERGRSISLFGSNVARYATGGKTAEQQDSCPNCGGDPEWRDKWGKCPKCGGKGKN